MDFFSWQLTENITDVTGVEEGRETDGAKRKIIGDIIKKTIFKYIYMLEEWRSVELGLLMSQSS